MTDSFTDQYPLDIHDTPGPSDASRDQGTSVDASDIIPLDVASDNAIYDLPGDECPDECSLDTHKDGDAENEATDFDVEDSSDVSTDDDGDSQDALDCQDVPCNIECPDGFKIDGNGCRTCRCRECDDLQDCFGLSGFLCDNPVCTPGGDCVCDCRLFADHNYVCPDGTVICMGRCGDSGVTFMHHVEEECPTLCQAGRTIDLQCPGDIFQPWCQCMTNDCRPECRNIGTANEGWYQSCTGEGLILTKCAGHKVFCDKIGSKSEGWYDTAGNRLSWIPCSPSWVCAELSETCTTLECSGAQALGQVNCPDGRSSQFCSCAKSGTMACPANPQATCGNHWRGCVRSGEYIPDDSWLQCCPGTTRLRPVVFAAGRCVNDEANPMGMCTECGDAECESPEDRCNCPEDCLDGEFPGATGSACLRDTECPPGLVCAIPPGQTGSCVAAMTRKD